MPLGCHQIGGHGTPACAIFQVNCAPIAGKSRVIVVTTTPEVEPSWPRSKLSGVETKLETRSNSDLQHALAPLTEKFVTFRDLIEGKAVRQERRQIDAAGAHHFHQAAHAFFAAGTQRRHDAMIADARRKRVVRKRCARGVPSPTRASSVDFIGRPVKRLRSFVVRADFCSEPDA